MDSAVKDVPNIHPDTFYDFYKERFVTNVLGFYIIIKNPPFNLIISCLCIFYVAFLYTYGVTSGFYTLMFIAKDKSEMVQAFYAMGLMGVSIGFHVVKNSTNKSLSRASEFIRSGIYQYNEIFHEELMKLKIERIKRIRFLVGFVCNGMYFCASANTFIPLVQFYLNGFEFNDDEALNPFLPMHLYVPFDTRCTRGFVVAFISNAVIMYTMYACFAAHAQLYISCSLQLTLELEILNYSLKNMERRACLRLKGRNDDAGFSVSNLYDNTEFQKCIYLCLRENILHHHAILRFRDTITPYIQTAVTVVLLFFSFLMAAGILVILENSRPQLTLLTDLFGFFPLCWVGQQVMNESGETKHSLFATPWPKCSENFKVLLKIFLINTQRPIILRASGFDIKLCLETFGDMVSVGYKIMNVMR